MLVQENMGAKFQAQQWLFHYLIMNAILATYPTICIYSLRLVLFSTHLDFLTKFLLP